MTTLDPVSLSLAFLEIEPDAVLRRHDNLPFTTLLTTARNGWQVVTVGKASAMPSGELTFVAWVQPFSTIFAAGLAHHRISQPQGQQLLAAPGTCYVYGERLGWEEYEISDTEAAIFTGPGPYPSPPNPFPGSELVHEHFGIDPRGGLAVHFTAKTAVYLARSVTGPQILIWPKPADRWEDGTLRFSVYNERFAIGDDARARARFTALAEHGLAALHQVFYKAYTFSLKVAVSRATPEAEKAIRAALIAADR